jgi:chromosome segregation ATPase
MNILGMFKGLSGDDGDNANVIKLINNLDEKFTGKINLSEEKLKKIEETNYKTNKDVVRVLNTFDLNKRNIDHMKENIESLELRVDSLQKDTDSKFGEINTKYDPKLNTIENSIEELNKKNEINSNLIHKGEIVQQNKEEEKQNLKLTLENKDKINELTEHLSELDKFIKSYVQKSGVDQIKNDISSLKTAVWNCSTLDDIKETKEREEELQKQISVLKENIDDLNANQIDHDDYNSYKRKVESLLNRMNDLDTTFTELLNRKNISLEKNKKHPEANKF